MKALLSFLWKNHKGKVSVGSLAILAGALLLTRGCDIESGGFKIRVQPVHAATNETALPPK